MASSLERTRSTSFHPKVTGRANGWATSRSDAARRYKQVDEMRQVHWTIYESPIGPLTLVAGPSGLTELRFPGRMRPPAGAAKRPLPAVVDQLEAYFAGERRAFELALDPHGTPLQKAVWRELLEIPYGTTTSYGELAARIDASLYDPGVEPWQRARIVGAANGHNPISIVIPCHRVIGADGSLIGYGGGLPRKRALLDLERGIVSSADMPLDPH